MIVMVSEGTEVAKGCTTGEELDIEIKSDGKT